MRELVERVLGAEAEAATILDEARRKASELRAKADEDAAQSAAAARDAAAAEARSTVDAARSEAKQTLERTRAEDEAWGKAFVAAAEADTEDVVGAVVAMVLGGTPRVEPPDDGTP